MGQQGSRQLGTVRHVKGMCVCVCARACVLGKGRTIFRRAFV